MYSYGKTQYEKMLLKIQCIVIYQSLWQFTYKRMRYQIIIIRITKYLFDSSKILSWFYEFYEIINVLDSTKHLIERKNKFVYSTKILFTEQNSLQTTKRFRWIKNNNFWVHNEIHYARFEFKRVDYESLIFRDAHTS